MSEIEKIRLFDNQKIRTVWVEEEEKWYFSVKDVVTILTETTNAKDYISKMRRRDEELSKGWGQIVHPLTVQTAGGPQKENCATLEGIFRIIQSIPSKKAEPFKVWMASVATERINQMIDPERSIDQASTTFNLPKNCLSRSRMINKCRFYKNLFVPLANPLVNNLSY